ncbi:MAG TPA: response regulator transcription factor [Polyangiaceae bacterium]|jgi:two-component system KDP operon response regulator KdpE|nr:response regulator transcription factor [Polyangiaceae bacterium]
MHRQVPFSKMRGSPAVQALVLVVEDEPQMRRLLVSALASFGYRSLHVGTKGGLLTRAVAHEPDLVVVDVGQAEVDGVGLTARLRDWTSAPILALLAHGREKERVELLDAGANDYLVKPFATEDLLGRVRVWLRQVGRVRKPHIPLQGGGRHLEIDGERRVLLVDGREVHLTPLECKLLLVLARHPGRAMTDRQILEAVWGDDAPQPQYLRAQVRQLRQKIEGNPDRPQHLLTESGGGYRLKLG